MTVRLANEVRAVGMPVYCSACFGQNPTMRHIDFDAAADRGYGDGGVSMDDLILCENCVKAGAILLGMMDTEEFESMVKSLGRRLKQEQERADRADKYANELEMAFDSRPTQITVPRRRGRPTKDELAET